MRPRRTGSFLENKIKPAPDLKKTVAGLKARGKRVVFTNGCFDLLHYGHVKYLEEAKSKGDVLVVAVNSDASVRRIKGPKRPLTGQHDRLRVVAALHSVDYVTLFNEDTPYKIIKSLRPDILVKGSDWDPRRIVGRDIVKGYGGKVLTVKLAARRSTTNLIAQIIKRSG